MLQLHRHLEKEPQLLFVFRSSWMWSRRVAYVSLLKISWLFSDKQSRVIKKISIVVEKFVRKSVLTYRNLLFDRRQATSLQQRTLLLLFNKLLCIQQVGVDVKFAGHFEWEKCFELKIFHWNNYRFTDNKWLCPISLSFSLFLFLYSHHIWEGDSSLIERVKWAQQNKLIVNKNYYLLHFIARHYLRWLRKLGVPKRKIYTHTFQLLLLTIIRGIYRSSELERNTREILWMKKLITLSLKKDFPFHI